MMSQNSLYRTRPLDWRYTSTIFCISSRDKLACVPQHRLRPQINCWRAKKLRFSRGTLFNSVTSHQKSYTYKKFTPVQFVSEWRNKFVMEVPLHCVRAKADALTLETSTSQTLCGGQFSYQLGWQNQIICLLKYTPLIDPCLIFSDLSAS